ncbi:MAG: VWA domain-containing protein, partial [Treponema sp.]|nr:VWA domain-containing protein [Treponema sp.]
MGKFILCFFLIICSIFCGAFLAGAQDLSLSSNDILIEPSSRGGYDLFVRSKPDISSVLLAETTKDPQKREEAANYGYRAVEKNEINGDEIRLINGFPIPAKSGIYSLISSTPKWHPELGWSYHIYIPQTLIFGYDDKRNGQVEVGNGTYFNIRTFYYAYADYRGPFMDNPFLLEIEEVLPSIPEGYYSKETIDAFTGIAGENLVFSTGKDTVDNIMEILLREKNNNVDIVICLDATKSMLPYIDAVRVELIPMVSSIIAEYTSFRIGMVLYKDYSDDFITKIFPFTNNFELFQRNLNNVRVSGGGDIPEAVYEALYAGATNFAWEAGSRIMILIGDAPP